jgi:Transposase and inactivated derivatives
MLAAAPPVIDPSDPAAVVELKQQLQFAHLKIQLLEERLRLERIRKYGPASEKLNNAQLELLEQEPGVSNLEVIAESEREPLPAAAPLQPRRTRRHPGRQALPANLARVERVIPGSPEQSQCAHCGEPTEVIGYEQSEQLDVEPAKYFVLVVKREKRGCCGCHRGVVTAPAPARIIEKSLVSDRVVIDTVIAKYCDHLPLYRQSAMLERETGLEISRATLDGWVMTVGQLLIPLTGVMRNELLGEGYIQADETPVDVQMHDRSGSNHQAYLWQYGKPGGSVVFEFQMGRGRAGPKQFLEGFEGVLQTDGYIAYEKVGGPTMVHVACWAHARRGLFEAHELAPGETVAKAIVERIDELFAIDRAAREKAYDLAARHEMRAQHAPQLLRIIKEQLDAALQHALPASKLGKAVAYVLGQWPRLEIFLQHPEVELSNNLAENSMRGVAIGRKNWIHIGSPTAGPRIAAILSVTESCRRLGVPIREYLAAILPGLADVRIQKLANLTPAAWAACRR